MKLIELKKKYELTLLYSDTILILTPQVTEYFWPSRHNFLDIDMTYYMILIDIMIHVYKPTLSVSKDEFLTLYY